MIYLTQGITIKKRKKEQHTHTATAYKKKSSKMHTLWYDDIVIFVPWHCTQCFESAFHGKVCAKKMKLLIKSAILDSAYIFCRCLSHIYVFFFVVPVERFIQLLLPIVCFAIRLYFVVVVVFCYIYIYFLLRRFYDGRISVYAFCCFLAFSYRVASIFFIFVVSFFNSVNIAFIEIFRFTYFFALSIHTRTR